MNLPHTELENFGANFRREAKGREKKKKKNGGREQRPREGGRSPFLGYRIPLYWVLRYLIVRIDASIR